MYPILALFFPKGAAEAIAVACGAREQNGAKEGRDVVTT